MEKRQDEAKKLTIALGPINSVDLVWIDLTDRQNPDADLPGCHADDEGENDRSLITSDTKPDRSNQAQTVRSSSG